jgi:hypothetical protein
VSITAIPSSGGSTLLTTLSQSKGGMFRVNRHHLQGTKRTYVHAFLNREVHLWQREVKSLYAGFLLQP